MVANKATGAATQVEQNARLYLDDLTVALDKAGAQAFRTPDPAGLGY